MTLFMKAGLILAASGLIGCVSLKPWERGNLAKPQMALDPYPLQSAYHGHNYSSREAGSKSNAAQGGGCGCN